ncbi:DUF1987 domain-containing protein [Nitrincola sp. MINF-07-Sa-05]|uniref:DUF1987 domain-containing protein n=1 Tax=Nitrincola salilacus TaxID=3400273 RepID=UPI0039182D04
MIKIEATERSPRVEFDFSSGSFLMAGESFPEDAAAFFGPLLESMQIWLADAHDTRVQFDLHMIYFNSSSAKALMNLFQLLEDAARNGRPVTIHWHYESEDETMEEFGEDFSEDFEYASFVLRVTES